MTGTLEHLDPHALLIGDNVRDHADLDKHFVASVREHGVLQPITAMRTDDGVQVRDGQRRTLAAREAKLDTIPVYVLDSATTDEKAKTAQRIAHQIVANDQRSGLTDAQRARGITQMLLAGVTPTKVAKSLAVDRDTVTDAVTVSESPTAMAALDNGQLSLSEAAALHEFEDDEQAVTALLRAAGTPSFDHRVAQLRQDRIAEQARADAEKAYKERGFMILGERPSWRDTTTVLLRYLRTADGAEATDAAVTDPSQWAVLLVEDTELVDAATGDPVDDDDVDWSTQRQPQRQPAEGTRHADSVVERSVWVPEYYCRDPQACGLTLADFLARAEPIVHGSTDRAEPETARDHADALRAQRRKVLVLNKLGAAAADVRRAWIRDHLLHRKTPVKGAMVFALTCLHRAPALLADHAGTQVLGELFGETPITDAVSKLTAAADGRAQVLLLGMVLAALEGRTPKDAWRGTANGYRPTPGPAEYLTFLVAHGYPLSAVEQVLTGDRDADDVYREATAA